MQRVAIRKILISIFTIIVVIITTFATTYAWVGILTASSIEQFQLNFKTQEESNYSLLISTTEDGLFKEALSDEDYIDIKRQILKNMDKNVEMLNTQGIINEYNNIKLEPISVDKGKITSDEFYLINKNSLNRIKTNKRLKFDLFLSLDYVGEDAITEDTNIIVNLLLDDIQNTLVGNPKLGSVVSGITYPSNGPINTNFLEIKNTDLVSVNPASSARVALSIYSPILLEDDSYSNHPELSEPYHQVIYQGGSKNPYYDEQNDTYSFGGILPEEYNLAYQEYKNYYHLDPSRFYIPEEALNREDLELTNQNAMLANNDLNFGIINGKRTKIKITVDFWFEGWDADCFEIICKNPVNLNLVFATAKDE